LKRKVHQIKIKSVCDSQKTQCAPILYSANGWCCWRNINTYSVDEMLLCLMSLC